MSDINEQYQQPKSELVDEQLTQSPKYIVNGLLVGLLVAPWSILPAAVGLYLFTEVFGNIIQGQASAIQLSSAFDSIGFLAMFGIPIAYMGCVVIGIPAWIILFYTKKLSYLGFSFVVFIACLIVLVISGFAWQSTLGAGYFALVVANTSWLVGKRFVQ